VLSVYDDVFTFYKDEIEKFKKIYNSYEDSLELEKCLV